MTRRGVALWRAGRDGEAIAALGAAVRSAAASGGETEPVAWQYLAAMLWRAEQRAEALAVLREAVLAQPDAAWPWRHLGAALLAAGRAQQARLALTEAVLADPADSAAAALLATTEATPVALTERLATEPPDAVLATDLAALGVLALGLLRRAEPAGPVGWRMVISLLGRLSPDLARQRLAALVDDEDPARRLAAAPLAAALIGQLGDEPALRLLADDDDAVRAAVRPAVLAGIAANAPALGRLLAHGDPRVRQETVAHLSELGDPEPLRRVYVASDDAKVRRECLRGFGQMAQADLLALVLWDEVGALRAEAARLLGEQPDGDSAAALRDRIEAEPDDYVRGIMQNALTALVPADEPECELEMDDAQSDPGPDGDDGLAVPGDLG